MDQIKLFKEFFNLLLNQFEKTNNKLTVYAHNLSEFDGVLLLKHLFKFGKAKPLLHNGKLFSITLKLNLKGHTTKTIIFKDSYLMLPYSLRELCNSFKIKNSKGYFPILLNDINYKGVLPNFEFFKSISISQYLNLKNQYTNKIWNFKKEAIKYCELDCVSLHEILTKFSNLIFNEFKQDPIKSLSLPALAMRIWKTSFMPKDSVYQLTGQPQELITRSYTGGAVDVYIPKNKNNEILYDYDVNSLYPSVMKNNLMPVGKPVPFEGNIRDVEPGAFGFFFCEITTPDYLEHPILQRRIKTANGIRTIAGLGSWSGWIFSEEMDNAIKYGYQFNIIKGYQFDKADIFSKYIDYLYNIRLQYPKGDAMNLTAKLLMNSLYGKFGMKTEYTKIEVLENNQQLLNKYIDKFGTDINDIIHLDDKIILVLKINKFKPSDIKEALPRSDSDNFSHQVDVNVAIASAITAYARIKMSTFKNNPDFTLYNSDTDNIVINKQLPEHLIGKELGQMKLEHIIKKAVFLAPKVYGLIEDNGNEIIKAKGLTKDSIKSIKVTDLELLLKKDSSRLFTQDKSFKNLFNSNISVLNTAYTLKSTSSKRELIYVNGVFDSTKPLNYKNIK